MARPTRTDGPLATLPAVRQEQLRETAATYLRVKEKAWAEMAAKFKVQPATVEGWTSGQYPTAWPEALEEARLRREAAREERLRQMDDMADAVLVKAMSRVDDGGRPDREAIEAAKAHKRDRRDGEAIAQRREGQKLELSGKDGGPVVIALNLPAETIPGRADEEGSP